MPEQTPSPDIESITPAKKAGVSLLLTLSLLSGCVSSPRSELDLTDPAVAALLDRVPSGVDLGSLPPDVVGLLVDITGSDLDRAVSAINDINFHLNGGVVDILFSTLQQENNYASRTNLRVGLVELLADCQHPALSDFLGSNIGNVSGKELEAYVHALCSNNDPKALDILLTEFQRSDYCYENPRDPDNSVGKALIAMGTPGIKALKLLCEDPDPHLRAISAITLGNTGEAKFLDPIIELATTEERPLNEEATLALANYPQEERAIAALQELLGQRSTSFEACQALSSIKKPALEVFRHYLDVEVYNSTDIYPSDGRLLESGVSYSSIVCGFFESLSRRTPLDSLFEDPSTEEPLAAKDQSSAKYVLEHGIGKLVCELDSKRNRSEAMRALSFFGPEAISALAPFLDEPKLTDGIYFFCLFSFSTDEVFSRLLPFCYEEGAASATAARHILSSRIHRESSEDGRKHFIGRMIDETPEDAAHKLNRVFLGQLGRDKFRMAELMDVLEERKGGDSEDNLCGYWSEILSDIYLARQVDIHTPFRYTHTNLEELVANRRQTHFDGRDRAVLVAPEADHVGAFGRVFPVVNSLIRHGYNVQIHEAGNEIEVIEGIRAGVTCDQETELQPARVLLLMAHSSKTGMCYGFDDKNEVDCLDIGDYEQLMEAAVFECLEDGGQIVVIGCSAGEGGEGADNFVNMLRRIFQRAKENGIWSMTEPGMIRYLVLDNDTGELKEAVFSEEGKEDITYRG